MSYDLQDMCFWNASRYRIYENQPTAMIGTFGPAAYSQICPNFHVIDYKLLNGKCKHSRCIFLFACALKLNRRKDRLDRLRNGRETSEKDRKVGRFLGTEYFDAWNDTLFGKAFLDRDASGPPPGGPGPRIAVEVQCVVWEEITGNQYALTNVIHVDVLDQDDNPPMAQGNDSIDITLREFTAVSQAAG